MLEDGVMVEGWCDGVMVLYNIFFSFWLLS